MPYSMGGKDGLGSVCQFILALCLVFLTFCEIYSEVKLELSLILPASFSLILMLVNIWLVVSLLAFVYFMAWKLF